MRWLLQRLALYTFHIVLVRPLLRWAVGVHYRRRNLIPDGPCVVVSNHNSHLDAAVLMSLFPLRRLARVHPVAAADYFGASWFKRTVAMLLMNAVPFERHLTKSQDSLAQMAQRLRAGERLIFFPEGSRGDPGVLARFRPGIGLLVQEVPGLLVVPVFLSGPERVWPRGRIVPVPLRIDCNVGRPRAYPASDDPRVIADQVRHDVQALAPPMAPQPGQRVSRPLRIAVCGSDPLSRSRVVRALAERLGRAGRTLAVGQSILEADSDGVRASEPPTRIRRSGLGSIAAGLGRWRGLDGARLAALIEGARIEETAGRGRDARFVVSDGGGLVELAATATGLDSGSDDRALHQVVQYLMGERRVPFVRWGRLLRHAPAVWVVHVLGLLRTPAPDVLVRLVPPAEPTAAAPPAPRGGPTDESYGRVAEVLRRRHVVVLEVDLSRVDPQEAARRIDGVCLELAHARAAPAS